MSHKKAGALVAAAAAAVSIAGTAVAIAPAAHAQLPNPEITVSAQTGAGDGAFVVRNDGNVPIPAGTQFTFNQNMLAGVGLGGDASINQDWSIGALGSGFTKNAHLKEAVLPGQEVKFYLARVDLAAFYRAEFSLTDPNTAAIDTNYQNNTAGINCSASILGLGACSTS